MSRRAAADGSLVPAAAVAGSAVLWGCWWWPLRWLDAAGLPGDWASLSVYVVATAVLAPVAWARRRHFAAGGWLLVAVGGLFGVMLVLWNRGVIVGDVLRVTLLFYLAPVWATLFARALLKTPVPPLRVLSIALGLGGAAVVLSGGHGAAGGAALPLPQGPGDWLGLAAGVLFAGSATLARLAGTPGRDGTPRTLGGFEQTFTSFALGGAFALPLALAWPLGAPTGAAVAGAMPAAAAIALLWLLPQTWLVLWGAGRLDPGRTTLLLLLEVVAAAVSSALLTDEVLTLRDLVGCALILSAGGLEARAAARARLGPAHGV
jgi:drug/metabolite transporter (DMT)-like permease